MYQITIISLGGKRPKIFEETINKYKKFLKISINIKEQIINSDSLKNIQDRERHLKKEAELIKKTIPEKGRMILLREEGELFSSKEFATVFDKWSEHGAEHLYFVIGGPHGISTELKKEAYAEFSLSPLTMPHDLAEVVLYEQLYRATTILKGKQYHY